MRRDSGKTQWQAAESRAGRDPERIRAQPRAARVFRARVCEVAGRNRIHRTHARGMRRVRKRSSTARAVLRPRLGHPLQKLGFWAFFSCSSLRLRHPLTSPAPIPPPLGNRSLGGSPVVSMAASGASSRVFPPTPTSATGPTRRPGTCSPTASSSSSSTTSPTLTFS